MHPDLLRYCPMNMRIKKLVFLSLLGTLPLLSLEIEELSWEPQGPSAQEFNSHMQQAISDQNWWRVIDCAEIIAYHFPDSPFAQDTAFLIGESYFNLNHPLNANEYFSVYLNSSSSPKHFEQAITYKFYIAERFKNGERKPLFDSHKAPKWLSAKEDAIDIYDEVIATLPHSELAAKSLLGKAILQAELEDYKLSLETLDLLIRRFPKHELAPEAYLEKMNVFLMQCQGQSLDPDLLDLAEVTLRKFQITFPREPRVVEAGSKLLKMREAFANNLLETGRFFEKTKKLPAAKIYFHKIVSKYPDTPAALIAQEKLNTYSNP